MNYQLLQGNCLDVLRTLPTASVQTCVTSPPYLGLRSYLPDDHPDKVREIGQDQTPDEYVANLVEVFREVRRALTDDGTLWLNLAASYNGSGGAGGDYDEGGMKEGHPKYKGCNFPNFKPKDLIPIPWMVAMALQQDGWWLRADIIWAKSNGMTENVPDRPTRSHEYIFLLSKSRYYYYDVDAIREPHSREWGKENRPIGGRKHRVAAGDELARGGRGQYDRDWDEDDYAAHQHPLGRNKRDVWWYAVSTYRGAHFATFPPALIEPCVLAGSRPGDTVLDPFNGSGTTGMVALKHHRQYVGIDLNADYLELARQRLEQTQPTLLAVTP